jgi:hypothetical protein
VSDGLERGETGRLGKGWKWPYGELCLDRDGKEAIIKYQIVNEGRKWKIASGTSVELVVEQ